MSYVSNECLQDCKKCSDLLCSHTCHSSYCKKISRVKEQSSIPRATRENSLQELEDLVTFFSDIHQCDDAKDVKTPIGMTCDHIALTLTAERYIKKHLT